jgi:hypothetical protein
MQTVVADFGPLKTMGQLPYNPSACIYRGRASFGFGTREQHKHGTDRGRTTLQNVRNLRLRVYLL